MKEGDLVRIHLKDFPAHGKLGLIVGKRSVYTNTSVPYSYEVLLCGSTEIVDLRDHALEEVIGEGR